MKTTIGTCLALCGLATVSVSLTQLASAENEAPNRPNVVLIVTDDQGYGDLGVNGNPIIRTPHLDEMAAKSARLSRFYVSPVCTPTRACLMTGRYNYRTRAIDTFRGRAMMDTAEVTIAELLRDAGYATGIFGKWHLGDCYPMRPMDQGFETSLVHRGGGIGQPSDPPGAEDKYTDPVLFRNGVAEQATGYCTDVYFTEALKWAGEMKRAGRPFFLYLPTNCPHGPFGDVPPKEYEYYKQQTIAVERFPETPGHPVARNLNPDTQARVYAMIENIDQNVGRLRRWLDEQQLTDKTLVIFLTDNGRATPGYNAGLKGNKSTVYEGGIRSPFFACWPGVLQPGEASDRIAAHIDILPTLLEVCGVTPPANLKLDGRSIWPLLRRDTKPWPERTLVFQSHRGDQPVPYHNCAIRTERWKLVSATGFGQEQLPDRGPQWELFDMQRDPYETANLATEHPDVVKQLIAVYDAWLQDVSSTRPENYAPPRIVVGTPHEPMTVLTRQDWRGAGWGPKDEGYWEIDVADSGSYDLHIVVPAASAERVVQVKIGDLFVRGQLSPSANEIAFPNQKLPPGEHKLEAWVEQNGERSGVRFVEIRRTR